MTHSRFYQKFISLATYSQAVYFLHEIKNSSRPIGIFLHGGPGMSLSHMIEQILHPFDSYIDLVHWDQLGAGRSFSSTLKEENITVHTLIKSTADLLNYIQKNFPDRPIVLIGHSWGGALALYVAQKYPHLINFLVTLNPWLEVNERTEQAEVTRYVQTLAQKDPQIQNNKDHILEQYYTTGYWIDEYLRPYGYEEHQLYTDWNAQEEWVRNSSWYTDQDIESYFQGLAYSEKVQKDFLQKYSPMKDITSLKTPYLLISSEHDYITPSSFARSFFQQLENPYINKHVHLTACNHYSFLENPDIVLYYIKSLIG